MNRNQQQKSKKVSKNTYLYVGFCVIMFFSLLLMAGCQKEDEKVSSTDSKELPAPETSSGQEDQLIPIHVEDGQFSGIKGWLTNESVIYTATTGAESNVYQYNLFTGEKSLVYTSELPIVDVQISPGQEYLLIHTSVSTYEGLLTVTDPKGEVLSTQSVIGAELSYTWNPYNKNAVFISAFSEDWSFTPYLMNIEEKTLSELDVQEPFVQWLNSEEVVYLDWGAENPALFASLVKQSILNSEKKKVLDQIYQVKAFEHGVMTISVESDKMDEAVYTFMNDQFNVLSSFAVPQLSNYSDWLVPYSDFNNDHSFLYFKPLYSSEADMYNDGFQLIRTDVKSGEKEILLENANNEPLSCSPDGDACLYGYYFEKLIRLGNKEIKLLVKEEESL